MTIRWKECISAVVIFALGPHAPEAETAYVYSIKADSALTELEVRACFAGDPPDRLYASSKLAPRLLTRKQGDYRIEWSSDRTEKVLTLKRRAAGGCIDYGVDLIKANKTTRMPKVRYRENNVLLYAGTWLWLPRTAATNADILLRFELPEGLSVSAPWEAVEQNRRYTLYRLGTTPYDWRALVAIGKIEKAHVEVPGSTLRLAVVGDSPAVKFDDVHTWIYRGALSVASLYEQFPISSPQVLVVPIGPWSEPVPWGQVLRGGGPSVQLFIDQTRPLEQFIEDWTLVHELSHMLLPLIDYDQPWLYEGIATYYQNVLRARSGELSEQQVWQKHHEGFERGRKGTRRGVTLADASKNMMRNRAFMRVYWSGTAIALLADVQLRKQGSSLDQALYALKRCCLPSDRQWSALELMNKLDRLTRTKTFTMLYERYVFSDTFPGLTNAYEQLGLIVENGQVHIDDDAALAVIRRDITRQQKFTEGS